MSANEFLRSSSMEDDDGRIDSWTVQLDLFAAIFEAD